jgi:hypothetical protein
MAKITIEGRECEIAPYKLGKLRRAAPFIDRINSIAGALTTVEGMMNASRDACEVISIGLVAADPRFTADFLEDQFGMPEMAELQTCLKDILTEAGFDQKGEAKAPSRSPEPEGAESLSNSEELSASS